MRFPLSSILVVLVCAQVGIAQDSTSAWLAVKSNLPASLVLVDSTYSGRADGEGRRVAPGWHMITLVPPEVGAWDLSQPRQVVDLAAGDSVRLEMNFPYQYRIDSTPFGASVSIGDPGSTTIGETPLVYSSEFVLTEPLTVTRDGYNSATIVPGRDVINRHSVVLVPIGQTMNDDLAVEWNPRGSSSRWINWAAAALALGGGAMAVHYKFKADDVYDDYLQTGDPATKEVVDRYDTYSYIALGAMQVGVGILVVRLAF